MKLFSNATNPLKSDNGHAARTGEIKQSYDRPPSIVNYLEFVNYDPVSEAYMFQDNISCGACMEIKPLDAESRTENSTIEMLSAIESAFTVIPDRDYNPWIVQTYVQDEPITKLITKIKDYCERHGGSNNAVRDHYVKAFEEHLKIISDDTGLFYDDKTRVPWKAKYRVARLTIYRNVDPKNWSKKNIESPKEELVKILSALKAGLNECGLDVNMVGSTEMFKWMYSWFNPKPKGFDSAEDYIKKTNVDDADLDWDFDIPSGVIQSMPKNKNGHWYFNDIPHKYIPILGRRRPPVPGATMLETSGHDGHKKAAVLDRLPSGSIWTTTTAFIAQDDVGSSLDFIKERAKSGENSESRAASIEVTQVQDAMFAHKIYPTSMGIYIKGETEELLESAINKTISILQSENYNAVPIEYDKVSYNSYLHYLPMSYKFKYDTLLRRTQLSWFRDTLAIAPFLGQATGTDNPGLVFFNRAGQPVLLDMFNPKDRERVAHSVIFGPTGAGKSASVVSALLQVLMNHGMHLYVIDVGESYRLLGDYCKSLGMSVNYMNLDEQEIGLPPFANSPKLLEKGDGKQYKKGSEKRDYLGEMEAAAKLMITGGDDIEIENYRRHDKSIVQAAIMKAAIDANSNGKEHAKVDDFIHALDSFISGEVPPGYEIAVREESKRRLEEMRDSARIFTSGTRGKLFNGIGADLGTSDITIIDLGKVGLDKENTDIMNLAVIGLVNTIQSQAEARRGTGRQTLLSIDEAHVTTANPLVADYLAKGSKMWRRWGLWLWMITQNLEDYPDASAKILTMAEFWICLSMPSKEVKDLLRFKKLSDEEQSLIESARKEKGKYAEGVILSEKKPMLIRLIPTSLALALAQSDEDEVSDRRSIMQKQGLLTDLEGAYAIAESIELSRRSFKVDE